MPSPPKTKSPRRAIEITPGESEWVALGEVARPHGVRGEVRVKLYNATSNVLLEQEEVLVRLASGEEHEVSVDGARRADQAVLLKLHSVDDRDRAEELRGAVLCVRREVLPAPGEGEFYAMDVVGARVVVLDDGGDRTVGEVVELQSYPSVDTLVVRTATGQLEVPLVDAYVETVDVAQKLVRLRTLDGLEE